MAAAAGDAHSFPVYNARYRVVFPILDADGDLVTGATGLDSELSQDQGTFADATNEATEIATSSGMYYLDLTAGEMDTQCTAIIVKTSSAGAKTTPIVLYPRRLPVVRTGTAQAGGASTITLDSGASASDNHYTGCYVNITNNSPANAQGQRRTITGYVGSTKVATVDAAWGTNPSSASTFEILAFGSSANYAHNGQENASQAVAGYPKIDNEYWKGGLIPAVTVTGVPEVDITHIAGAAVSTTSAQLGVNVVNAAGTAWNSAAIGAATLAAGTITAAKFGAGAIDATAVANGAIDAATFAAGAIDAAAIANGAIDAATFAAGAIDAAALAADCITAAKIANGAIDAATFAAGAIDAAAIANGAIDAATFAAGAIDAAAIANGAIDAATFAAGAIDAAAIATGAIDADALAADAVTEIRSLVSGTSDSGTTTTMVDAARTEADTDYWKGKFILFTSGTISGQCRLITGFTPGTDTIAFAPATTQAVGTQTYEILASARADVELWDGSAVNALIAGRVDANAQVVGDKTGYSIGAGGIAAAAFAASAIDAAAIATDAIGSAELAATAATEIADAVLARNINGGSSAGRTVSESLAPLRNRVAIAAGTMTVYDTDDVTPKFTAAVTTTAGNPVTEVDPA